MKEAETSSDGSITYLKKGAKVRLDAIGDSRVLVEELSEGALADGVWATSADKLVTEEEYAAMQEADDAAGVEPIQLKRGAIYVMKRPEVSGNGRTVYLKKDARVRVKSFSTRIVLVQDLSDDMISVRNDYGIFEAYLSNLPKVRIHITNKVFYTLSGFKL